MGGTASKKRHLTEADVERFLAKVDPPNDRGCREWSGFRTKGGEGYGQFGMGGRGDGLEYAHRVAFFIANGYWAEETRHDCDNPPCCEPTHLLDGDRSDNVRDSVERGRHFQASKTHCAKGHPYDEANTYLRPHGRGRECRTCRRDSMARHLAKRKSA